MSWAALIGFVVLALASRLPRTLSPATLPDEKVRSPRRRTVTARGN